MHSESKIRSVDMINMWENHYSPGMGTGAHSYMTQCEQ